MHRVDEREESRQVLSMVGSAGIADKTKHGWAWERPGQKSG